MAGNEPSRIPRILTATAVALVVGLLLGLFGPFADLFGHPCDDYSGTHVFTIVSDGPGRVRLREAKKEYVDARHGCTFTLRVDNSTDSDLRVSFDVRRLRQSFDDKICAIEPGETPRLRDRDARKHQAIDAPCRVPGNLLGQTGGKIYDCDRNKLFGGPAVRCFEYVVRVRGEGIDQTFDPWIRVRR